MNTRDIIALVELIFYIPFSLLSAFVCYRHGFSRSSGWLYTLILCVVRIIGSIFQFASHTDRSIGMLETIIILDSVGLSPLLLATLGLLSRFVDFINASSTPRFTTRHFRILQTLLFVGLILAIVGGTSSSVDASGTYHIPTTSKAGVVLYVLGFVGLALVFFLSVPQASIIPTKERRIPLAIALALPFIFVRLIYSVLSVFVHNHLFSVATGSSAVRVGMAVIEEFVVVALYVLLGLFVDKLDATAKGSVANRSRGGKEVRNARGSANNGTVDPEAQQLRDYSPPLSPLYQQTVGVSR
ncbi:hypothetical protein E8E13_005057 [Curvularia kusanoi]|uniref:DUF7702 domain-containing protein n=1 Tax=Curvularia kusanoi TaxID=90978 RepID=A0A9P4T9M9_CURKU|nr:hypothetical protein E8E13_005057 [Curvularia kusanoi]